MSDQCQHCKVRGNIGSCCQTECGIHESWYAKELSVSLSHSLDLLRGLANALHGIAPLTERGLIAKADAFIKGCGHE